MLVYALVFVNLWFSASAQVDPLDPEANVVVTAQGAVRGYVISNRTGEDVSFVAFEGIPYAEPPVGDLRFREPVPKSNWDGILNATQYASQCTQWGDNGPVGSEDCLYLNVYTPQLPQEETDLLPVLFWIHGGAFYTGSGNIGPDYFIPYGIVVVSINYRLDVFGFLSTQDTTAPGNFGLKDVVQGLRWVQENIAHFGGDPLSVTIMGESSGAAFVHYLVLAPLYEEFFRAAIAHSGSVLNVVSIQPNPMIQIIRVAQGFDYNVGDTIGLVESLRQFDSYELLTRTREYTGWNNVLRPRPFVPVIEPDSPGALITESSYLKLQDGNFQRVPYLTGTNSAEAIYIYDQVDKDALDQDHSLFAPVALNRSFDSLQAFEAGTLIYRRFYQDQSASAVEPFLAHWTSERFRRNLNRILDFIKYDISVYNYLFSYKGSRTSDFPGVSHAEELQYFWFTEGTTETEDDRRVRQRVTRLWSNFVKYLNPTPPEDPELDITWSRVYNETEGENWYLVIDNEFYETSNFDQANYDFWKQIFDVFGNPPYLIG